MQNSAAANAYQPPSTSKISNPRLLGFVRIATICFFIFWVGFGLISLPSNWRYASQTTTQNVTSFNDFVSLGVSVKLIVVYNWLLLIINNLLFLFAATLVFRYCWDDWLGIAATLFFTAIGIPRGYGNNIFLFLDVVISSIGISLLFLFFYLFPYSGRRKLLPIYLWIPYTTAVFLAIYLNFFGYESEIESQLYYLAMIVMTVFWALGLISLVYQYIKSKNPKERWQIKLLTIGMGTIAIVQLAYLIAMFFPSFGTSGLAQMILYPTADFVSKAILMALLLIAILPQEAWQFKMFVNQSLIYFYLFIFLLIAFFGLVLALQLLLQSLFGTGQSTIAAMFSVAAIASIFSPLHRWLQGWINRQIFGINLDLEKLAEKGELEKQISALNSSERPEALETNLSSYILHDTIGSGGMGKIYRATQKSLKRQVAIKVSLRQTSAEAAARFEREARIMARLQHPHIVKVFDFGILEEFQYIVMEYIEGESLGQYISKTEAFNVERLFPALLALADALDYAHSQGVVHRDIKPSNVMLRPQTKNQQNLEPILLDFGLGKFLNSDSAISEHVPMGTLAYMAPEQIRVAEDLDHRVDIYALGVICYQLFTGELPFPFTNPATLLFAHLYKPVPDPRLMNPNLSDAAATAILRALEKSPELRPQSALDFVREFVPV